MKMKKKGIIVIFFISLFFLSVFVNVFPVKSLSLIEVGNHTNLGSGGRRICIDSNGVIHTIYSNSIWSGDPNSSIFYEHSTDNGLTWTCKREIPNPNPDGESIDRDIVVDSNDKLWVAYFWRTSPSDANYVRVVNSTDGGYTWGEDVSLNATYDALPNSGSNWDLAMGVDDDDDITLAISHLFPYGGGAKVSVHHLNSDTGVWSELHFSGSETSELDLSILSNDTAVVAYEIEGTYNRIKYFYYMPDTNTNSSVHTLYNDASNSTHSFKMLADSNDIVHFIYMRGNGVKINAYYKNLTNGVLSDEEVVVYNEDYSFYYPTIGWTANGDIDVLFFGKLTICGYSNYSICHSEKPYGGSWSNTTYMDTSIDENYEYPRIIYNRYPNNALLYDGFRFTFINQTNLEYFYATCADFLWCDINCSAPECLSYNFTPIGTNITINVYNESNPSEGLSFDVFITNQSGSETYYSAGCSNPKVIGMSDSPTGDRTSFTVHSTGYYPRTFVMDIDPNVNYVLNVYLAPKTANIYCLIVINEYNNPVDDVKMVIQRYMNTTDGYENMSILYTDGAGQILVYLIPDTSYKITLSKTGYKTKTEQYIPDPIYYGLGYPKYFKIYFVDHNYTNGTIYWEVINFTCNMSNNHLYVNYLDIMNHTLNTSIIVYEVNTSTGEISVFGYSNHTTNNSFQTIFNDVNMSNCYKVVLNLNHSLFGFFHDLRVVCDINTTTSQGFFDNIFNLNYGSSPGGFGWSNIFGFIILVSGLFAFGQQGSGVAMIVTGGLLAFINSYIGLTVISVIATSILIVFGILIVWQNQRRTLG